MADVEQATAGLTGNEATIAAMADVLAAVGGGAGLLEWADEDPAAPAPAGQPVAATGVTIGHGPIRFRDSAPPTLEPDAAELEAGTAQLDADADADADAAPEPDPEPAPSEPVGHGAIRFVEPAEPEFPDTTALARAHIFAALDLAGDGAALDAADEDAERDDAELELVGDE